MYQYWLVYCNKSNTPVKAINDKGNYRGGGVMRERQ